MKKQRASEPAGVANHTSRLPPQDVRDDEPPAPMAEQDKAKLDKFVDGYFAIREMEKLLHIGGSVLQHIGLIAEAVGPEITRAVRGRLRKAPQTIESELKRLGLSLSTLRRYNDDLKGLTDFANQIEDDSLRLNILERCRGLVENAMLLGNIAVRDRIDAERSRLNGKNSKNSEKVVTKTKERHLKVAARMLKILEDSPKVEWSAAWKKFYSGSIRKEASRGTLEKDARTAYNKHFIEPSH